MNEFSYADRREIEQRIRRWEAEDRTRPRPASAPKPEYATPQSTIDAFLYLGRLGDQPRLARWLEDRPLDADFLKALRQGKEAQ